MNGVQLNNDQEYSGIWKFDESQGQLCTQWIGGNAGCSTITQKDKNTLVSSDTVVWTIVGRNQQTKAKIKPKPTAENSDKPSFDCTKARSGAARLICSNAELSKADADLGNAFHTSLARLEGADRKAAIKEQVRRCLKTTESRWATLRGTSVAEIPARAGTR